MKLKLRWGILLSGLAFILAATLLVWLLTRPSPAPRRFDGEKAYQDVLTQMEMGPRTPGSPAHAQSVSWIKKQLEQAGWRVEVRTSVRMGHELLNIFATRSTATPQVLLGAHYDCRMSADQDPNPAARAQPVPGANDGASGVAVLLELARTLPKDTPRSVGLLFIDGEDQGDLPGWDWILGSSAFAEELTYLPQAVVIIDMIGDANLNIYQEQTSNPEITRQIWAAAQNAGYSSQFIPQIKYSMLDDHTPFLKKNIPAVDLIDFDYPAWHTRSDTADKLAPQSLKAVGETLWQWLSATPTAQ